MILRNELFRELRIIDALTDAISHVFADLGVRLFVHEDLDEVLQPQRKTRLVIQLIPERDPLLAWHIEEPPAIWGVFEAAR